MSLIERLKQMFNFVDYQEAPPIGERQTVMMPKKDKESRVEKLTPREYDVYLLLLEGFTLKESAKQLSIKYPTANTHMTGIYKKLGVNSRAQLIINYRGITKSPY